MAPKAEEEFINGSEIPPPKTVAEVSLYTLQADILLTNSGYNRFQAFTMFIGPSLFVLQFSVVL